MKRFLHRWEDLPLLWQVVTIPILLPAFVVWIYPEFHAFPVMIGMALVALSSSGYIEWLPWPKFIFSVSLPYVILVFAGLWAPIAVMTHAIGKKIDDKK